MLSKWLRNLSMKELHGMFREQFEVSWRVTRKAEDLMSSKKPSKKKKTYDYMYLPRRSRSVSKVYLYDAVSPTSTKLPQELSIARSHFVFHAAKEASFELRLWNCSDSINQRLCPTFFIDVLQAFCLPSWLDIQKNDKMSWLWQRSRKKRYKNKKNPKKY